MQKSDSQNQQTKVLLVANVAKEHVLKFHIPTIRHLTEAGWHVDVACSGVEPVPYCNHQFVMSYKRSPFNLALFKGIRELKNIITTGQYDIVYCHTPVGALAARIASRKARKRGTKVVYMAHGFHFYRGAPLINWLLYYPMEKILSYWTDSLILINQEDYELAKRKLKHKGNTYLINGIGTDLSRFYIEDKAQIRKKYRTELNIPENAVVLVYMAELIANKNQTLLMDAVKQLRSENRDVYLVLAGIDHTEGKFREYAQKIGVEDAVRFLGWRSDIANLYAMADICTASSLREGCAINIIEAMASGIPVVATDNRGHRTIIRNGETGYLVPLKDASAICGHIASLIDDPSLYQRIRSSAKIDLEKYSVEQVLAAIYLILSKNL